MKFDTTRRIESPRNRCSGDLLSKAITIRATRILVAVGALGLCSHADLGDTEFKLLADDGEAGDLFGEAVAISNGIVLVGANNDADNGVKSGSAYLFDAVSGAQIAKLLPNDGSILDQFGCAVGLAGCVAIVGAPRSSDLGTHSGSAYLFDTRTGLQTAKLLASDGEAQAQFGVSVAVFGNTALVGAGSSSPLDLFSGSAYLFDTASGLELVRLIPSDGEALDFFGSSVALNATTAVIGAPGDDDTGTNAGAVYLFDLRTGVELAKLVADDGEHLDDFGDAVAVDATTIIVGAPRDDDTGTDAGAAYLFDATTGLQTQKLIAGDGSAVDLFGRTVGICGPTAIVGAMDDELANNAGAIYLFDVASGRELAKILASDGELGDDFGRSVAIEGSMAVAGARFDDDNACSAGAAYLLAANRADQVVRNGSGINPSLLSGVSIPALGSSWELDLDASANAGGLAGLVVFCGPLDGFFVAGGELLVDVTSVELATLIRSNTGAVVRFSLPLPDDSSLLGLSASGQGVFINAAGIELSNAIDAVAGF